jgi:hypothetical protein
MSLSLVCLALVLLSLMGLLLRVSDTQELVLLCFVVSASFVVQVLFVLYASGEPWR